MLARKLSATGPLPASPPMRKAYEPMGAMAAAVRGEGSCVSSSCCQAPRSPVLVGMDHSVSESGAPEASLPPRTYSDPLAVKPDAPLRAEGSCCEAGAIGPRQVGVG